MLYLLLVVFQAVTFLLVQGNQFNLLTRISGGQDTDSNEFPFIVNLNSKYSNGKSYRCGGSIISPTKILTSAHCCEDKDSLGGDLVSITVKSGAQTLSCPDPNVQIRTVTDISRHSSYSRREIVQDIAILELDRPLTYNEYVKPICLASGTKTYVGNLVTIMGWGATHRGGYADTLQKVTVQVLSPNECDHDQTKTICTADPRGGHKSTCGGDSGGPLVVKEGNNYKQIGLVSYGMGSCGNNGKQTVYTRVTAYRSWIQQNVGSPLTC